MFCRFKTFIEEGFDEFIWPQLPPPPPTNKNMATALVLPVTTATCERTFSTLRRLKTYLRTSLNQERLYSQLLAVIYPEIIDQFDNVSIATEFVQMKLYSK
jgi:hypothetical protein